MLEPVYFGGTVDRSVGSNDLVREIRAVRPKGLCFSGPRRLRRMLVRVARRRDRIVVIGARDDSLSQFV